MTEATLRVVGASPPRLDALAKVTGQSRYASDLVITGMVHAKVWRSPLPHAYIERIAT
jgi:CO/xanthine dehydrogenase Mo-binding subunit